MLSYIYSYWDYITLKAQPITDRCRPNPKHIKSLYQQEMIYKRNVSVLVIYICLVTVYLTNAITGNGPFLSNIVLSMFGSGVILCMFLSCRYHHEIFNIYYNLICLSFGPVAVKTESEGAVTAFMFVQVIPLFLHLITRSFLHFLLQVAAQTIFLNTIYQKPMEQIISYKTPEAFLQHLTFSSNLTMILQVVLVVMIDRILQQCHDQTVVAEQRKNQAENQKNFVMGFSHELRNLINSLTGNVKLASLEHIGERTKELLLNAEVCGELLLQLINNILDTGKAEIGELEINPAPTATFDAFERIWGICSELIQRKDLKGFLKIPKDFPRTLIIDHHRLTQIFLNLVGNSVKFTEKGSIQVKLEWIRGKKEIDEKCFQPYPFNTQDEQDEGLFEKQQGFTTLSENFVTLSLVNRKINKNLFKTQSQANKGVLKIIVSDTGCGMDKTQTGKLFQKFTQVTNDASKKKLGTGLGLFITRQLCQRMQGEIRVYSQKGNGSSFVICVPAESGPDEGRFLDDLEAMKSMLATKKLKAMIVDDAPFNHVVLKTFFEKLGIETVEIAVNGLEAVQKYSRLTQIGQRPEIVAMDLDMPIMDGKEASVKIRDLDKEANVEPCFLLINSGNCVESEINECLDLNGRIQADIFMKKPVRIEELTKAILAHFLGTKATQDLFR